MHTLTRVCIRAVTEIIWGAPLLALFEKWPLGDVAKARGMAQIAKDAGLGRESLYKTLSAGAHPRFETIKSVLHTLGVKFAVVAGHEC